LAKCL